MMIPNVQRGLGLALASSLLVVTAGCAAGPAPEESTAALESAAELAPPVPADYAYWVVTKVGSSLFASALNQTYTKCADGRWATLCRVDRLDTSSSGLRAADVDAILKDLTWAEEQSTLLFVGKLGAARTLRREPVLKVWEIWRAPERRRLTGDVFHVSHDITHALVVNSWSEVPIAKLDLSASPEMLDCEPEHDHEDVKQGVLSPQDHGPGQGEEPVCRMTHDGVIEDAKAPAGIVAFGRRDVRGNLRVRQYFLKIGVGDAWRPNGFFYCQDGLLPCENLRCSGTLDTCEINPAHGRGLIYARTPDILVQPWLVGTTQLWHGDIKTVPLP